MGSDEELRATLRAAIDGLYEVFAGHRVPESAALGFYDPMHDTKEVQALLWNRPLRAIPEEAIWAMEFYGAGWGAWGDETEVKHFLPRILELVTAHLDQLTWGGAFSLFKYKLHGALESWPEAEGAALRSWAVAAVDYHLHRRWDSNFRSDFPLLVAAALELGMPGEMLTEDLSDFEGALAMNRTDDGQELLLLDALTYSEDEGVLEAFEKAKEGILQLQLDAIDEDDEVWAAIDQLPEDAIPGETRRRLFCHEVFRFQKWAAAQASGGSEWETEYADWPALRLATKRVLELPHLSESHQLLYVLARDNEDELVLELLDEHPDHGMRLARDGLRYDDHQARWQLAVFLGRQDSKKARLLLREHIDDSDGYVRRRALLASAVHDPEHAERTAIDWLDDPGEYIRMAAVSVLWDVDSAHLGPALEQLASDPSAVVRQKVEELRTAPRVCAERSMAIEEAAAPPPAKWETAPVAPRQLPGPDSPAVANEPPPALPRLRILGELVVAFNVLMVAVLVGLRRELGVWYFGSVVLLLFAYLFHLLVVRGGMMKGR